jgi:hypothetical protein
MRRGVIDEEKRFFFENSYHQNTIPQQGLVVVLILYWPIASFYQ